MKSNVLEKVMAVCFLCVIFLAGCFHSPEQETESSLNLTEEMWGEWLRIDKDESWYISKGSIKIGNNDITDNRPVTLIKQSSNIIQVTEGSLIYYLYASRTANASFSGRVAGFDDQASRSIARNGVAEGKGWITVVVDNLNNGTSTTTTTDAEGGFSVDDIIPGDDHKITPEQGEPIIFSPIGDGDDAGTITVVEGDDVNFKVSIKSNSYNDDMSMLTTQGYYSNGGGFNNNSSYSFTITIENTGGRDATAATYALSLDSGLSFSSGSDTGILGTIEPGKSKTINIGLMCDPNSISGDYDYKKINVIITDTIANRTWNDSVSLRFFKETIKLQVTGNARGMVIVPIIGTKRLSSNVVVPKFSSGDYIFIFCGATADSEGEYSLKIADLPYQDGVLGIDLARYEPNNTVETATVINSGIHAYLHKNDIDYYQFRFKTEEEKGNDASSFFVAFNSNGGSKVPINFINSNGTVIRPANPTRSGCTFDNWYSDSGLTTLYNFSTPVTENITLHAKWNYNSGMPQVVTGENLTAKFTWLRNNWTNGGFYIVEAANNESINNQSLSFSNGSITISLKGSDQMRTISLLSNGQLFTVNNGVTLILDENITLQGQSSNNNVLVSVNSGGTLIMNAGSRIIGNSNNSGNSNYGGGVYVNGNGTFNMNGGTISGNTVIGRDTGYGGGVYVAENGTCIMSGGVISGNTAIANTEGSVVFGGGVYVNKGIFAKTGGIIYGYTAGNENNNAILNKSGGPLNNQGHALYATGGGNKHQETTAGLEVDLLYYYESDSFTWNGYWDY